MNRQHYDLLTKLIYARGTHFSQDTLAHILDVSPRSIRNYISTINEFLENHQLPLLQTHPNGDVLFEGSQNDVIAIQSHLFQSDFYRYHLSAEERRQVLYFIFLTAENYITINELAAMLYVSKTTLAKNIDELSSALSEKGIFFCNAKTKGYRLNISEWDRRKLLLEQVDNIVLRQHVMVDSATGASVGILYGFAMQMFDGTDKLPVVQAAVCRAESENRIQLNDEELQRIIHGLIILITRLNYLIVFPEDPSKLFKPQGIADRLSQSIVRCLSLEFDLKFTETEQNYIAYALEYHWLDRRDRDPFNSLDIQLATKRFIYSVSKDIGLELYHDSELQHFLSNHLQSMLYSNHRLSISNAAFQHVEMQYQDCSAAVERNLSLLESVLGQRYSRFELQSVLLYITAAVERLRRKQGAPKAIIVCNSGIATARFLSEKLLRNFNIDIVSITSVLRLEQVRLHCNCDLIITTVPISISNIPCVWVSPVLTRKDMIRIFDALNEHSVRFAQCDLPSLGMGNNLLREIFPPNCIATNCHASTWREAIQVSGSLLSNNGLISEQYVADMIRCVEENGPYIVIVPGVALAHAAPPFPAAPFHASLACFSSPVEFHSSDNDPVWCVISLQATNQAEHIQKLLQVMNLVCNIEFRQLTQYGSKQELMDYIYGSNLDRKE